MNRPIYGHTHALEKGWPLTIKQGMDVMVHNTGAFQRTIDEEGFLKRVRARNLVPHEALRAIKLEELPPCYSAVLVTYREGMPESRGGVGCQSGVPIRRRLTLGRSALGIRCRRDADGLADDTEHGVEHQPREQEPGSLEKEAMPLVEHFGDHQCTEQRWSLPIQQLADR
jgi:hypothetical protein